MTKTELMKWCCDFLDMYTKDHSINFANAVLSGIDNSDDPGTVTMKMCVNSALYASQISAMTVLSLLIDCGVIDLSKLDASEFPEPLGPIS